MQHFLVTRASVALVGVLGTACDTYVAIAAPPGTNGPDGGLLVDARGPCRTPADGGVDLSAAGPGHDEPPIAGGTLLVTHAAAFLVASEPDEDAVYVIDRSTQSRRRIELAAHDEPGRIVEDGVGHVHVVLRRSGAVVRIDPATATILSRESVCVSPRGIAYHAPTDTVRVACMDGQLLTLPANGGPSTASVRILDAMSTPVDDLRDVVIDETGAMYVTTFRRARIFRAPTVGAVFAEIGTTAEVAAGQPVPRVAWRMIARPGGGVYVVQQVHATSPIDISGASCTAYGGGTSVVETAIATVDASGRPAQSVGGAPLPVDVATDGARVVIASAANGFRAAPDVIRFDNQAGLIAMPSGADQVDGQVIAVALVDGHLVMQTRAPAAIIERDLANGTDRRFALDYVRSPGLGHVIFHSATSANLACASCHAEGNDDGHVWHFAQTGPRRTQTFRGGFLATAPFHWDGSEHDMAALVDDVFVHRMGGAPLAASQQEALAAWMDALPALPSVPPTDVAAVERGRELFESPAVACASCHSGPLLTNNASVQLTQSGPTQVPSLRGLRWRAPYMHTGCAATLADRFDPACGGGEAHGHTAGLSDAQRADLVAYLETL